MKGTKLWQAAGSPIIQGQSRRQRASWQQWLPAWAVVSAVAVGFLVALPELARGSSWAMPSAVLGGLLGSFAGVQVARAMGWRFPVLWGIIVGLVGSAALFAIGVAVLPA